MLSDLHTEFEKFTPSLLESEADVVVLAGDIGTNARGGANGQGAPLVVLLFMFQVIMNSTLKATSIIRLKNAYGGV